MTDIHARLVQSWQVIRDAELQIRSLVGDADPDSVDLENLIYDDPTIETEVKQYMERIVHELGTIVISAYIAAAVAAATRMKEEGFSLQLGGAWEQKIVGMLQEDNSILAAAIETSLEDVIRELR